MKKLTLRRIGIIGVTLMLISLIFCIGETYYVFKREVEPLGLSDKNLNSEKLQTMSTLQIANKVHRILFIGNSITWQGGYVNDIEAYLTVHYPDRKFEFINVGLPSETVSGLSEPGHADGAYPRPDLHERLKRVLKETNPDLIFASYGMNDGIYLPFDSARFKKFQAGINWLNGEVAKLGIRLIQLTPSYYDNLRDEFQIKNIGYTNTLDQYSNWMLSLKSQKIEVIDIYNPMREYLQAHRKVDSEFKVDGFDLTIDGIHPNEIGHWMIAKQILLYLGCKDAQNSTSIRDNLYHVNNGVQILKLVTYRQNMMRDAWLTATKYKRPGLPVGLPLNNAQEIALTFNKNIDQLLQNKKVDQLNLINVLIFERLKHGLNIIILIIGGIGCLMVGYWWVNKSNYNLKSKNFQNKSNVLSN